jgi:hypothetical protein
LDCRNRAFKLMQSKGSCADGTVTVKDNYTSKQIWVGHIPRLGTVSVFSLPHTHTTLVVKTIEFLLEISPFHQFVIYMLSVVVNPNLLVNSLGFLATVSEDNPVQ